MKYLSLFSGIGGFELGIGDRGKCVGFSEIDKYAIQIYQKHFNHKNYGDITKINPKNLPDFEMLVGGFPCQSFSIAGKRQGFNDTRGTLFFEICKIVREKQPRIIFLENVKGLLSHDKGWTFHIILSEMDDMGYDVTWQVLNSKNFGVPQNRERVFIIGHLRGTSRPEVFPFGESDKKFNRETDKQRCSNTLTGRSAGGQNGRGNYIKQINKPKHSNDRIYSEKGISPTLNTMQGGNRQPFVAPDRHGIFNGTKIRRLTLTGGGHSGGNHSDVDLIVEIPEATKKGYAEARVGDSINLSVPKSKTRRGRVGKGIAQTLDTGMQQYTLQNILEHPNLTQGHIDPETGEIYWSNLIRRLTPTECERLQGFPDNWTEGISDTQRYKTLGNAVTVNVVREIIKKLI